MSGPDDGGRRGEMGKMKEGSNEPPNTLLLHSSSTRQQYYEQAAQYLLQEGGKHWACRHHTIVCELLWLWLYSSQQSVQFLQTTLAAQVSECLQCAVALNTARVAVLDCAIAPAPAHTPSGTALRDAIRRWDAVRLSSIFEKFGGEPEPRNGPDDYNRRLQGTLCSHVQVLLQPKLLLLDDDDGKRLNASFSASLAALAQGDLRISGTQPLPGLYLLCVHSNSGIRSWARTQVLSMATLEHPALFLELHEVFDVLVHHCERLTMIRNGCDEDEQEGTLPLPLALSDDEREVWTGFTMVIRHLAPWIVRDQLLTRYGGLLPLALMSVVENSAAVLPAAQCVHYMMRCLGRSFWQVSICSFSPATMRRVLANLATNPSAIVPVRQTCLELLEEVLVTASSMGSEGGLGSGVKGTSTLTLTLSDDIASFLSSRELRSSPAAHVAVSAMATRVLTRVLQRLLDRGGLSELPIISSTEWAPHVAGTACSPNLPLLSKSPPAILLARILALQATSLESALLRRSTSLKPTEHCGANVAAEGRKEQDGKVALPNSVMWLESVWGWLLQNAGTDNIPEQMHVALLQAARTLLIWPCDVADAGADSYSVSILRRFTTLITGYLQSIAGMSVLVATLAQKPQVEQALVELALVQKAEFKEILRELIYRALGMGNQLSNIHGIVPALQVIACRSPTAIAAGMRYAFGHAKQMGLEGDAFGSLHHLFLIAGQMVPLVLPPLLPETRHELLQAAWDMTRAFIQCRARLRTDCVMKRHGAAALDATSSSFFTCFRVLWPHFATLVADAAAAEAHSDDKDFDERPHQSLASAHALWLPAFVKWGGISSVVVRKHWCSCMVTILCTLRACHQTFTPKEKSLIDKLIARRDLWTDEQYLALCTQVRPLGSAKVKGNLGMSALADLPSESRGTKALQRSVGAAAGGSAGGATIVDLTGDSVEADEGTRNKSKRKQNNHSRARNSKGKKHDYRHGEVGSLSSNSDDGKRDAETENLKPKKRQKGEVGGVMRILADMGGKSENGAHSGAMTFSVGGHVLHVGGPASKDVGTLDALGKRTRRLARSAEELQDEFLVQILWWDLRQRSRQGLACSKVPIFFDSLDQYEDNFGALLLEETWEQITSAFSEEHAEVEDDTADFGALRVHSYDEIGDFVFAAVCLDRGSSSVLVGTFAEGGSGRWCAPNQMDLVLLVSPDSFVDAHSSTQGVGRVQQRGHERKQQTRMEHVLALVDKAQSGDTDMGIVRLKVLSRKTPRNKRFCERLARVSTRNGFSGAHGSLEPGSMPNSDQEEHTRLRMVCLNHNISTSIREFVALHSLRSLDALTQSAILAPGRGVAKGISSCTGNVAVVPRGALNDDQMQAISKCLEPGPVFSLIQGPPGTGKTSTLVGLLTALLAGPSGQVQAGARVLVCAPSNAAVDELAKRVSLGLAIEGRTERYRPSVVRIGAKQQMRTEVWDAIGLECQVLRRLAEVQDQQQSATEELNKLKGEVEALTERLEKCEQCTHQDDNISKEIQALQSARKRALALVAHKAVLAGVSESKKAVLKRQLRKQILENAQIVCVTLSGAGTVLMQSSKRTFNAVIVDEAAQALEPSLLIPLQLKIERCILVGDPQQLPATVTSRNADANLFARSLFERLQAAGHSASLLAVQYRMHPFIRAFPSDHFYGGKLIDCLGEHGRQASWHCDCRFAPLVFYDIKGQEDGGHGSNSRSNPTEAKACVALLQALQRLMTGSASEMQKRVAIMSPYRRQCSDIRRRLNAGGLQNVEVSSVDAFQGREIDVAVLSCVRAGRGGLGFVADIRRLNVAITRARCSLLILGNAATLSQNDHWAALIEHARSTGCCVQLEEAGIDKFFSEDSAQGRADSWPKELLSMSVTTAFSSSARSRSFSAQNGK